MPENATETSRLCLAGDWTIHGIAEQFPLLAQHLSLLQDTQTLLEQQTSTAHCLPEMDLAGITELDACGCQLLAQFSRALQQSGMAPLIRNIPEAFMAKIRLLGYDHAFNLSL